MFFDVCPDPIFNYNTKLNCSLGCFAGDIEIELLEEVLPAITTLNGNVYLINPTDTYTVEWETLTFPADCEPTITDPTKLQSEVSFPCFGTYTFQLTITDSNDNVCVSTCTATITNSVPDPCEGSDWPTEVAGLPFTASGSSTAPFTDLFDAIQEFGGLYVGWNGIDTDRAYALITGVVVGDFTAEFDLFEQGADDAFQGGIFLIDNTQQAIYLISAGSPETGITNGGIDRTCDGVTGDTINIAGFEYDTSNLFDPSGHVVITKIGTTITITVNDILLLTADLPINEISNIGLLGIGTDSGPRFSNISITAL